MENAWRWEMEERGVKGGGGEGGSAALTLEIQPCLGRRMVRCHEQPCHEAHKGYDSLHCSEDVRRVKVQVRKGQVVCLGRLYVNHYIESVILGVPLQSQHNVPVVTRSPRRLEGARVGDDLRQTRTAGRPTARDPCKYGCLRTKRRNQASPLRRAFMC
jgi:hypothetical protein